MKFEGAYTTRRNNWVYGYRVTAQLTGNRLHWNAEVRTDTGLAGMRYRHSDCERADGDMPLAG
jgi:hypothetical protein